MSSSKTFRDGGKACKHARRATAHSDDDEAAPGSTEEDDSEDGDDVGSDVAGSTSKRGKVEIISLMTSDESTAPSPEGKP